MSITKLSKPTNTNIVKKVRRCLTFDQNTLAYLETLAKEKNLALSYLVNYYSNEFIKFHKEASQGGF